MREALGRARGLMRGTRSEAAMLKEAAVPRCFGRRSDTRIAVHWHSRAHDDTRKEFGSLFCPFLFSSHFFSYLFSVSKLLVIYPDWDASAAFHLSE